MNGSLFPLIEPGRTDPGKDLPYGYFRSVIPPLTGIRFRPVAEDETEKGGQTRSLYGLINAAQRVYNQLHYSLLFVGEAANEPKVVRMASATPSGCTCGARCPPFATR